MGEQERPEAEAGDEAAAAAVAHSSMMQRVKVYRLCDGGKWDDQGTGHVAIDYIEGSKELGLTVLDEEDNGTLLMHNITSEDIYRKQEETIISWRDPDATTELALSFQEAAGCSYIWDNICDIQRNLQFSNLGALEVGPRPASESLEASRVLHSNDESFRSVNGELRELPPVELSNLPLILKTILEGGITDQMRVAELIIQDHDFFPKLLDIFRMCEDLENIDDLHMIFKLVRGIILLNSSSIFDKIFSDEFILDIIGALEYDPEVPQVQKHRTFLKDHVVFKEAIPIKNVSVVSRIHQTYRIGYLKDVILPRILDDATLASLNTMIHTNNAAVISLLKDDPCFIQELFARMRSPNTSMESKRELVLFLHEFCTLSKSLPLVQQLRLFRDLSGEGVFEIISDVLQSQDRKIVSAGTDILILFLNQDPNLLRSYIVQQEGNSLLGLLVKGMVTDFGEEMHCQFLEILRILMDSFTMSGAHRDVIIEIFYERHLDYLVDVIASSCPPRSITRTASKSASVGGNSEVHRTKPEILLNVCELLCFCVVHHPYRIKCNFLLNNAIEKILTLTRRKEKFLVVAAVRFMRTIISRNDEHLIRHVIKFNLLKPIIDAFVENGDRYNMLQSGVLELLEHIRKESLKSLVIYVIDSFCDQLVKFEHFGSIQAFKLKHQQYLESVEPNFSTRACPLARSLGVPGKMHPKTHHLLLFLAVSALAAGEAAATTLTATPEKLTQSDRQITIRWSDLPTPDALDYVAIYSPPSSRNRDFLGYLFLNGSASWPNGRGELALPRLPNLRAPYQFRLFRWPAKEYSYHHVDHDGNPLPHGRHVVAVSGEVAFADSTRPEQVHLAFADRVDEMRVLFVCGDSGKRVVRYGLEKEEKGWREVGTEVTTYEQKHMCDWPANDSVAWRDPGFVFDGLMKGLEPGRRYFYKVGSDSGGWSETYSFIPRDNEANETIAFLFGDMGTYVPYNTYIHTQEESLSTVKWILRDIQALGDKPAFISHIGDISYARGYAWVWDHFFSQIEPIAANTPYHVCIGNHEYDWPSQPWKPEWAAGIYGNDGGGECGIPYSVKFRMPGNSILPTGTGAPDTRNLYYSFDSGVVHFVYMSTETNFVQGSNQYNFLKADLDKVNRSRTPFVVFQGHRPMYTSSNEARDFAMRQQMLQHLEPLLVTYNVTLALWGHVHRYERFCPIKNFQCLNMSSSFVYPGAPVHVVIGMGGQDWQPIWQPRHDHPDVPIFPQPERSMYRGGEFGYTKLVATREKLTLMYVGNHDGQVHDMLEIFSGPVSSNSSVAVVVDDTKLSSGVSTEKKISPLYLEVGGGVMFALLLGFAFGFLVRRKTEAAQWTPVKNEES